ncbi:MAG: dihydrofolate reductase [Bacteroidales bacterium]|nr:dihydrofolate reductase [Bacteroidales bacterium]HOY37943.1 dihydrofolate reductase [Bacteroidales bacterium]HQP03200.1 dihydrofolate reductase [Bacteroidales bacterium]
MSFSIIVAIGKNFEIGANNDLLWHISGDLKRFKSITTGHTIIMGKKTYESLPVRPLPNRRSIVLSDIENDSIPGVVVASSIEEVKKLCNASDENFIIGGGMVYRQFLPLAEKLYLTLVHRSYTADVYFPEINYNDWNCISAEEHPEHDPPFSYKIFTRKK